MSPHALVDHFFRAEAANLIAILTRRMGLCHFELVEDAVQHSALKALETWGSGPPANPRAWALRVAQNRAIDLLRKQRETALRSEHLEQLSSLDPDCYFEQEIEDSQLRMIFACCHSDIPVEAQIALTLKALCGFQVAEIAHALLTSESTIEKRLYRARQAFRQGKVTLEVPCGEDLKARLDSVHSVLYLLFNEGYCSSHPDSLIRRSLCEEAMRLCRILCNNALVETSSGCALMALFLFQAARFDARLDAEGKILLLEEQDRALWSIPLIQAGFAYLSKACRRNRLTAYHLQAGIAAEHCIAPSVEATNWKSILHQYDLLIAIHPSPVHELNRAVAIAQVESPEAGLRAIAKIKNRERLSSWSYLDAILGELYRRQGNAGKALLHFRAAMEKTTSIAEKELLAKKCASLNRADTASTKGQSAL